MNVFLIIITIICYCIALLIAACLSTRKSPFSSPLSRERGWGRGRVFRYLFSNATRFIPFVACLMAVSTLVSCASGGSPDDHTGENWILLIVLLLCWLKG